MKETLTYKDAVRILQLRGVPSSEKIETAYKKLAKRYHPDLNPNKDTLDKMAELNIAIDIVRKGPSADVTKLINFRKEYDLLKSKISSFATDKQELQDAEVALHNTPEYSESAENGEKLEQARRLLEREIDAREYLDEKTHNRAVKSSKKKIFIGDNYYKALQIDAINDRLRAQADFKKFYHNKIEKRLHPVTKHAKHHNGKIHIPLQISDKGKKVIKYVILTAGILAAIIAGKYAWDHRESTFKPVFGGLLSHKEEKP